MAVDPGAAVPRNVLEDGQHAALDQPLAHRQAKTRHAVGLSPVGAVPDYQVGAGNRQVEHRKAVDGDAKSAEIVGDKAGAKTRCLLRGWVRQRGDAGGRWIKAPIRRPQPRDPPAFLVDQHRSIVATDAAAQRLDQLPDLSAASGNCAETR